jgi:cobalt-zinc-cadmium efflux system protein
MQGVPENINVSAITKELESLDLVEDVHHIHVWSLDENNINFEAHVTINDMLLSETNEINAAIEHTLERYGINHVTIQFECECCNGECYKN